MIKKKVLLKDIARQVGVSTALVSYVLNNQKENRIGKEIADKIRQVAQELNYQPNQIAKSLKTQRTFTIGLIVADIANPFSSHLARIIEDAAKQQGYTVIFGSSDENLEKLGDLMRVFLNRQVDGLIIAAVDQSEAQIEYLSQTGVPFVLIDRYFPNKDFPYVAIDNFGATFDAVTHLLNNKRKKIGLVTYKTSLFHLLERKRGYEAALAQQNVVLQDHWIQEVSIEQTENEVQQGIQRMLEASIEAVLFVSNTLTLYGLKYLRTLNVMLPEQLAIVAFDEMDVYNFLPVPLSYVRQPLTEIGQRATESLLNCFQSGIFPKERLNLSTELIVQKLSA